MSNNLGAAVTAAISRGIILAVSIPFASQMNQHAMNFKTNYTGVIIYMYRDTRWHKYPVAVHNA